MIGMPKLRVYAAAADGPIGRPADGLALLKTVERRTACMPERFAAAIALAEWAEAVCISPRASNRARENPASFCSGQ